MDQGVLSRVCGCMRGEKNSMYAVFGFFGRDKDATPESFLKFFVFGCSERVVSTGIEQDFWFDSIIWLGNRVILNY
jgi:hypothetical protein